MHASDDQLTELCARVCVLTACVCARVYDCICIYVAARNERINDSVVANWRIIDCSRRQRSSVYVTATSDYHVSFIRRAVTLCVNC